MSRSYPSFIDELPLTRQALEFAAEHHRGQQRDADRAPFILHPLEVAQLLRECGSSDQVIAAGVLHDVLEDTDVERDQLRRQFGDEVARLVAGVTEPDDTSAYAERKAKLRSRVAEAGEESMLIYAADKVAKTRELRIGLVRSDDAGPPAQKLEHYWASLAMLERRLPEHPLVHQLRFELETLELLPPTGG